MDTPELEFITDSKGRSLGVRRLSRREIMKYMRQWGTACNIESWFSLALVVATVRKIDDRPLPSPQTADQVESVADMLGQEGTDAIGAWYSAQQTVDFSAERQAAKN